ncbi:MAG: tetraacyldisaccharide 4'-kinase [Proteobacteria bacterium]|nr:tetraacyldisaccharide 4'-kinase [Pseudomonadota bacterium]
MSRLQSRLQQIWYGGREPGLLLRLLSGVYGAVVRVRRTAYRRGWLRTQRVGTPVIVIGNLTVGGSGKTPLVIALVEHLAAQGWTTGVVSRGYGRSSRGQVEVGVDTDPAQGGDEPVLIARRTGVPVVVDADRVAAARRCVELGCDIVLADDGLQHLRLHRDIEIEVVDAARGYGNGRLLPAGPLREPVRAGINLRITHCTNPVACDAMPTPAFALVGERLQSADGRSEPLAAWRGRRVHAVAGIGHPRRFFDCLRAAGLDVVEHPFTDHHPYVADNLLFDERLPIVMTEKDWVKCAALAPGDSWYLPVDAQCPPGLLAAVDALLADKLGPRTEREHG